jgi:hypothetical protein
MLWMVYEDAAHLSCLKNAARKEKAKAVVSKSI